MRRARAHGPVHTGFRGVLALLVAVVALLCVFGHAERDASPSHPAAAQGPQVTAASEVSAAPEAPCGKKAIADSSAQRTESAPPTTGGVGALTPDVAAVPFCVQHSGSLSGGPAPPPPATLHSVLRI